MAADLNLAVDPHEQRNVAETCAVDVGYLTTLLDAERLTPRATPAAPGPLPPGRREQLRALGCGT